MNWIHVARNDLEATIRSKRIWAVTGALALLAAIAAAAPSLLAGAGSTPTFDAGLQGLWAGTAPVVPIVGLVVGYDAVVGERESGTARLLLGLPNSRLDVIVGKTLSRFAVAAIVMALAFLGSTVVLLTLYDGVSLGEYAAVALALVLFALVFVALGISISASVGSSLRAVGAIFGAYVLLAVVWDMVPVALYWAIEGTLPGETRPAWVAFFELLTPGSALFEFTFANLDALEGGEFAAVESVASRVAGETPFYLTEPFAAILFLGWLVVPLAVGYARFRAASLR